MMNKENKLYDEIKEEFEIPGILDFKKALDDVDSELYSDKNTRSHYPRIAYKVLLVISLLILLVFCSKLYLNKDVNTHSNQQFAMEIAPYKMILADRSEDESPAMRKQAISSYLSKDYKNAQKQFTQLSTEYPDEIIYMFYVANAAFGNKDWDTSVDYFSQVVALENRLFIEQSRYYLARAYFEKQDYTKAKEQIELIQSTHYKYKESREILQLIPD